MRIHWNSLDAPHLMQDKYEESMMKKKALEDELEDLEGKLQRAEKLLSGITNKLGVASLVVLVVVRVLLRATDLQLLTSSPFPSSISSLQHHLSTLLTKSKQSAEAAIQ